MTLQASTLPLTKSYDPITDYPQLDTELRYLEATCRADDLAAQTSHRRWEYAMALRALNTWLEGRLNVQTQPRLYWDVGGGGSPFCQALEGYADTVWVIDPTQPPRVGHLEAIQYLHADVESMASLGSGTQADAIFSLSVIEHVESPLPFLRACAESLKPGGLLFLTMDGWGCEGEDLAHFHWARRRIYNPRTWRKLLGRLHDLGLVRFGGVDWTYRGDQLYGSYSFFSAASIKPLTAGDEVAHA